MLSAFKNSPRKPFPLRKSDDGSSPTHPVEVDVCTASEKQRGGQIFLSPRFTEILEQKPPDVVGSGDELCSLLRQLGMGLKGRERERLQSGCYKVLMRIGLNFRKGKVRNGIDFALFELEVGGENGSVRETKGIFSGDTRAPRASHRALGAALTE